MAFRALLGVDPQRKSIVEQFFTSGINSVYDGAKLRGAISKFSPTIHDIQHGARAVAHYLLMNFPSKIKFEKSFRAITSLEVKNQYQFLSRFYDEVAQATLEGRAYEHLPVVQKYFEQFNAYAYRKSRLLKEVEETAWNFHPHLRTFPDRYGVALSSTRSYAKGFFPLIQKLSNSVVDKEECEKYRFFYYKNIALIKADGTALTWQKLLSLWVIQGGNECAESNLHSHLANNIYWRLPPSSRGEKKIDFQDFTIEATISEFEKMLGIHFDEKIKNELKVACLDEEIRMDLVFFIGHFKEYLNHPLDRNSPAYRWTSFAKKFFQLCDQWKVCVSNRQTLFRWYMFASPDIKIPHFSEKKDISHYAAHVENLGKNFISKVEWEKSALALLCALAPWDMPKLGYDLERFILQHKWNYLGPLQTAPFCAFLESGRFRMDRSMASRQLDQYLRDVQAQGVSTEDTEGHLPLYLILLYENWNEADIDEAKNFINDEVSVDRALQCLLNVAIKNRIEAFVGKPLEPELKKELLNSTERKRGILETLRDLEIMRGRKSFPQEIQGQVSKLEVLGLDSKICKLIENPIARSPRRFEKT